jgi:adenylosuccinate lyase
VQRHAMQAWETDGDFRAAIEADPEISRLLSRDQLAETFTRSATPSPAGVSAIPSR